MSHVTPAPLATSDTESGPPTAACTLRKHAPVLITENQVAFSTAAAAPVGSTRRRWLDTTLMGGLGRILTALTQPAANRAVSCLFRGGADVSGDGPTVTRAAHARWSCLSDALGTDGRGAVGHHCFAASRGFRLYVSVPDSGTADLIIQFEPNA